MRNVLRDLELPLGVICNDAGAGNIILSWLKCTKIKPIYYFVQGPSKTIKDSLFIPGENQVNLPDTILKSKTVLTGTGWQTNLEHDARSLAIENGIRSIAVIDHWVNYNERFIRNEVTIWPNEFWVTDIYAHEYAKKCFPGQIIYRKKNIYLNRQLSDIKKYSCDENNTDVLYVLEPVRSNWGKTTQGEFQALDYFMKNRSRIGIPAHSKIRLRPHPSDVIGKYDQWISANSESNVTLDRSRNLASAIGSAKWVAGCETYAMVLALESKRIVVSSLPPWAPRCRLPHINIIKLCELI
jgi:hypothetical protein